MPEPELVSAYRAAGQYIKVHAESGGYFVLAGEIGAPSWQLLVRNSGGAADALSTSPEGTVFEVTGTLGGGFPLARARQRSLVVAVVGSALAVARPLMRARIGQGASSSTTVYIGARTAKDVPLAGEVAEWVRAGVRVVLCLSGHDLDEGGLGAVGAHLEGGLGALGPHAGEGILAEAIRRKGWVQQVLSADVAEGRVRDGLVFAAGPAAMLDEIRGLARDRPRAHTLEVITNV
jgi:NAD(P)H-flavin reductase